MRATRFTVVAVLIGIVSQGSRADACSIAYKTITSAVFPRDGETGVPSDTFVVFRGASSRDAHTAAGAPVALEKVEQDGLFGASAYRAVGGFPPDTDIVLGDGRRFRTAPADAAPPAWPTWALVDSVWSEPEETVGCGGGDCGGLPARVLTIKATDGDPSGRMFHAYVAPRPEELSGAKVAVAFAGTFPGPDGTLVFPIRAHGAFGALPRGWWVRFRPVDGRGQEGEALPDIRFGPDDEAAACAIVAGAGRSLFSDAMLGVALVAVIRRRRHRGELDQPTTARTTGSSYAT